jgi:hypothetical protein
MRQSQTTTLAITALWLLTAMHVRAQRGEVSKDNPIYDNHGKPDLLVDPQRFVSQMQIVDRYFASGECAVAEGVVGGTGYRRLLRFDTVVVNMGNGDLVVGDRSDPNNPYAKWFEFHPCHGHYHIRGFSEYELLTLDGRAATQNTKQGFCFEDSFKYGPNKSNGYDCSFQGITSGWGDWYYKQLVGQWIDITGVPEGDYIVRVTINKEGLFDEGENRYGNVVEVRIHIPDPRNKVEIVE